MLLQNIGRMAAGLEVSESLVYESIFSTIRIKMSRKIFEIPKFFQLLTV